jgi:hypothetical protein
VKKVVGTWKAGNRPHLGARNFYVFKADGTFCQYSPKKKLLFTDKWKVKDSKTIFLRRTNVWIPYVMGVQSGTMVRQSGTRNMLINQFKALGQTKTEAEMWTWLDTFAMNLNKQSSLVEFEENTEKDGTK